MDEVTLNNLDARLVKLERKVFVWRLASFFLIIVSVALLASKIAEGNSNPQIVQATEFQVIGAGGKVVATLGVGNTNETSGQLQIVEDKSSAFPTNVTISDAGIKLSDLSGNLLASLSVEPSPKMQGGPPIAALRAGYVFSTGDMSANGVLSSDKTVTSLGDILAMKRVVIQGELWTNSDIKSTGPLLVGDETTGSYVDIEPSSIGLFDDRGNQRAVLGVTKLINTKTEEQTTTAPSSLTLFDDAGTVVWRDPSDH